MSGVDGAWLAAARQRRAGTAISCHARAATIAISAMLFIHRPGGYHEELGQTSIVSELLADMAAKGFDPALVRRSYERYAARMGAGTDGRISAKGLLSSTASGPASRSALLWTASMLCDSP